jgi:hypothetical protein
MWVIDQHEYIRISNGRRGTGPLYLRCRYSKATPNRTGCAAKAILNEPAKEVKLNGEHTCYQRQFTEH